MPSDDATPGALTYYRQFLALDRDVIVLSVAMFAFSLGFQMTGRYMSKYIVFLGGTPFVAGLYGSLGNLIGAVYPYPGGAFSDRVGSRTALTLFGLASALGFAFWFGAPGLDVPGVPAWAWLFVGLLLVQAWKSFGLGATFAVVKQSVPPDRLATGFASTETFRRLAFLVGPLLAAGLVAAYGFDPGFQYVVGVAVVFAVLATVAQRFLYRSEGDTFGKEFEGVAQVVDDLRSLPSPLRPLLVADTLVRFANGMAYGFFVLVVVDFLAVGLTLPPVQFGGVSFPGVTLAPEAYFGVLLAVEMAVALLVMVPVANLARRVGLKPVVALGFAVYAVFPALLVTAPPDAFVLAVLFAFSGLRFAGLPAHKALIVGPAETDTGGRVTGSYYLVRNALTIPSAAAGGFLYGFDPTYAFGAATVVGLLGTGYFLLAGEEFEAYA